MKNHPNKIYTDILEFNTRMLDSHRESLKVLNIKITETKLRKLFFEKFSSISLSTYNKYLKQLKDGTYIRCERD